MANKGYTMTAEHRAKIGAANTGKICTPETRAKLSAAGKGRPSYERTPEICAKIGYERTAKHRAVISAAKMGNQYGLGKSCPTQTHGMTGSRTYTSWSSMRTRCNNPKTLNYAYYGGRGITVCPEWNDPHGFTVFLADMGERPPGTSLDRIDNNGNYEPGNCRWATATEQRANSRPGAGLYLHVKRS
jgi:ribosomal protein L37E